MLSGSTQSNKLLGFEPIATKNLNNTSAILTGHVYELHPVPQWFRDHIHDVGRADEEDPGEVHRHVQVVVQEVGVLLRVQQL